MLAWRGGRRRLVREQKARRRLEAVFNSAAKISKPFSRARRIRATARVPETIQGLEEQFSALRTRTRTTEAEEQNLSVEAMRNSAAAQAEAAQASPEILRSLPAFPRLPPPAGVSLDILAIQGPFKTVFNNSTTNEEEISNENNVNDVHSYPPPATAKKKRQPTATPFSISTHPVSAKNNDFAQMKRVGNSSNDNTVEPMSMEL